MTGTTNGVTEKSNSADRTPRHDELAEKTVLSMCLESADAIALVFDKLAPEHFFCESNRRIYEGILALSKAGLHVDITSVAGWLRDQNRLAQVGGSPYLVNLVNAVPAVAHVEQKAERIVDEDRLGDRADDPRCEIGATVVRVVGVTRAHVHRDGVEGEVTRREVGVDPLADRREVDGLVHAVHHDPPGSVPLGERKDRPAEATCEAVRRVARVRTRDVDVENRPVQELVADRPADDPCFLVPDDLP